MILFQFAETAKEFEDYFISHHGKDVYAVYGMSMGGVLTATLWQNERLAIEKVIFDGAPLMTVNGILKKNNASFLSEYNTQITTKR